MSHIPNSGILAVIIGLMLAGICYSDRVEASTSESKSQSPSTVETNQKQKSEEQKESALNFGLVSGMHAAVREERIAALAEIDKERRETLAYLTDERKAVMEELKRTTDILLKERQVTMLELETMGNRIVDNAMIQSKGLIDHFFLRALQLIGLIVLGLCIIGLVYYRLAIRKIVRDRAPIGQSTS